MRIRDLLTILTNRRKSNARRRMVRPHELLEQLESRTLLTGNVLVSLSGAGAQITGDAGNNEIEVVVDNGSVIVRGLNGTTINSGTTAFTLANASTTFSGNLTALLGDGNDIATIGPGITFTSNVALYGEGGSDTLRALSGTYQRNLTLAGGNGATSIVIDGAAVSGSVSVRGLGSVVAGITGSTIHGGFDALTGPGNSADSIVIKGTTIDQTTLILTGRGDDNVVIQNSHLNGPLFMFTGAGDDVVYIDSSSVGTPALIATQLGNDTLQVVNSSSFSRLLFFAGGAGKDSANIASDTTSHRIIKASQNAKYFSSALVASRITDPTTGAIAAATALLTAAVPGLTLSTSLATFSESAGTAASVLTVTRTGPTTADAIVTLTSSNPSRTTVPATLTIPAGSASATVNIAAIDNAVADGNAIVTITAAANGLTTATRTINVTDDDTAALTVTSNKTTVTEGDGANAVTYTVSRNTADNTQSLVVDLTSTVATRLTVGSTVTIPANAASVTFVGAAVENTVVDGTAQVIVRASATGFTDGAATVSVTDNEAPTLTVTSNISTVAENSVSGSVTFTVSRNSADITQALTVNVVSVTPGRLTVSPATVTILANASAATFTGSAVDNDLTDGDAAVVVTASATGFASGTKTVTVTDNEVSALTVTPNKTSVSEGVGVNAVTYTVSRNSSNISQPLTVNLASNTTTRLTVPTSIIIPANSASVQFPGATINTTAIDGDVPVIVTATSTGFTNGTATVTVQDNDAGTLAVTSNISTIAEGAAAGALTYTVTRTATNLSQPLTVNLTSALPARLTVPATVTIAANATTATFNGTPVNDNLDNGNVVVSVTASASGFASGAASVTVNDNDTAALTVSPAASSIVENLAAGSFFYNVSRNTSDLTQALVVSLSSPNTARLKVPATVTIPVGLNSVAFEVMPENNAVADGNVDVVVTASATGFSNSTFTAKILDDEAAVATPKLTTALSVASVAENAGAGASVLTVTRPSTDITQALTVALTYSDTVRLSGPATLTIPAGSASATASLSPIDNLAVDGDIQVDITAAATGFASGQQTLTITDNEVTSLTLLTAASSVSEASGTLGGTLSTSIVSSKPIVVSMFYPQSSVLTGPAVVTIPAGASSVPVTFTVVNGSVTDGSIVANISAVLPDLTGTTAAVTVNDADTLALTAVPSASDSVQSNGTIITRKTIAQIAGVTIAGAVLTVDSNGDGVFDDGTATAGGDGSYTVNVTLTHTAANHGENTFVVRSVSGANSADTAVKAHLAIGSVVHFTTNLGAWDVELLDTEAGLTVTNFLNYVTTGAYQNMFVHRTNSGSAQFVQGGGFKVSDSQITPVVTNAPIQNQFNAANSNVAGTLAMALTAASINSGTSGWFINTTNNSAGFDPGKYTVFGRVIGDGLTVVSQISSLTRRNLNNLYGSTALDTVPLTSFNATNTPLTGQIATLANSAILTGTGTLFTTELTVGRSVAVNGRAYFVASIASNTSLTLTTTVPFTSSGGTVTKNVVPTDAEFVVFSDIGKILDTL